uniref:Uncharacterized protein n=1 Tax=Anser cygnoides TaxID=8845 RepID=A0A8B9IJE7_ANSCY
MSAVTLAKGLGKHKAGPWGNTKQGFSSPKTTRMRLLLSPSLFSAEFGKEKSVSLDNLSVDEVAKALENVVKGKV